MSGFNLGEFMASLARARGRERQAAGKAKASRAASRGRPVRVRVSRGSGPRAPRRAGASAARGTTHALGFTGTKGGQAGDKYMTNKGQMVATNMMGSSPEDRALEFALDRARHPRTRADRMVVHSVLSLPLGKNLRDDEWASVICAWRRNIGTDGNFVAAVHKDTDNEHVHIVWSRANRDGSLVSMSHDFHKHREAAHQVADELLGGRETPRDPNAPAPPTTRAVSAQRRATRRDTPDPWMDPSVIREALAQSTSPETFTQNLAKVGIEVAPAKRPSDGQVIGLMFRRQGAEEHLAGSSISREFSLPKIQAQIELNRQALQKQEHQTQMQRQRQAIEQQRLANQSQQVTRHRG